MNVTARAGGDRWRAVELRHLTNGGRVLVLLTAGAMGFAGIVLFNSEPGGLRGAGALLAAAGVVAVARTPRVTVWVGPDGVLVRNVVSEHRLPFTDEGVSCRPAQYQGMFTRGRTAILWWMLVLHRGHESTPLPVTFTTRKRALRNARELQLAMQTVRRDP